MTDTTAAPSGRTTPGRRLLGALPLLALVLAIVAAGLLIAGPLGWRAGWLHYRIGLQILLPDALYAGLAAMAVAALALIVGAGGRAHGRAHGRALALVALLIGAGVAYFPWHWHNMRGAYPTLNDVTTDVNNPPSLGFAEAMRQAEHGNPVAYGGPKLAAVQQKFYPGITPATLALPPMQAFERALAVATAQGWTIVKADPAAGVINADQRSRWFGFTDDIAIRVTPAGAGSRVDIRSAARQGRGDFGVNAKRVQDFLAALGGTPAK